MFRPTVCLREKNDLWRVKAATKKQKYEKISEKKSSTTVEALCKVGEGYVEQITYG